MPKRTTGNDVAKRDIAGSDHQPSIEERMMNARSRVTLPVFPGKTLAPMTREDMYSERLNKAAFGEIWDRVRSLPGFDEMTDEQTLELALEMQRDERRAYKQGR